MLNKVREKRDSSEISDDILREFMYFAPEYKRQAVEQAVKHPDVFFPKLLAILKEVAEDPEVAEDEDYFGYCYAMTILGHQGYQAAHECFLKIARLPEKQVNLVLGDIVTEELNYYLFNTCDGNDESLKALIEDSAVYTWCRVAAFGALRFIADDCKDKRDQIIEYFSSRIVEPKSQIESEELEFLILELAEINPSQAHFDNILKAYDEGWTCGMVISHAEVKEIADGSDTQGRSRLNDHKNCDIHSRMEQWACFKKDELPLPEVQCTSRLAKPHSIKSNSERRKKKKLKMQKKARRKNRNKH